MIVKKLKNVCPEYIAFDENDGVLTQLEFDKGCDGCFEVLKKLLIGEKINYVIDLLHNNECSFYNCTDLKLVHISCLGELSKILREYLVEKNECLYSNNKEL